MKRVIQFIFCVLLTIAVGGLSGYATVNEVNGWYSTVNKPSFNPPNYVFGPVWTFLYILMGISLFLIVISIRSAARNKSMVIFAGQLILNFFWSIIFFRFHNIGLALAEIVLLWLMILWMIVVFYRVNRTAALIQLPYIAWVSFASVLNAAIFYLN